MHEVQTSQEQDLGLSTKSPLNDRYFSQPDLLTNRQRSSSNLRKVPSTEKLDQDYELDLVAAKSGRHGNPRFVKSGGKRRDARSSAMSDTSEAPSIASHIKRVRVPSQASDVDQFLDDLFSPVLDGQTMDDGLSDAKSLAASMRGGHGDENDHEVEKLSRANSMRSTALSPEDDNSVASSESNISGLSKPVNILSAMKGDGDNKQSTEPLGFQPIHGMMSPTMSPPPMLMPTPIVGGSNPHSITSPLMMPMSGNATAASQVQETSGAAMAFTYVPVPVYNMSGVALPANITGASSGTGGGGGGPALSNMMSPSMPQGTSTPSPPQQHISGPDGSPSQPSSLEAQQLAYQQAFLQNAVAQNMQIQQQLMMQNQALAQLLTQSNTTNAALTSTTTANSSMSTIMGTPSLPSMIPMAQYQQMQMQQQMQQQQTEQTLLMAADGARKISAGDVLDNSKKSQQVIDAGKQRSLSTPNTPRQDGLQVPDTSMINALHAMDPYTRARTVR